MKILIKLLALCCVMLFCGTAVADMTARELRDFCTSKVGWDQLVCIKYIEGFINGHQVGMYGAAKKILGPAARDKIRGKNEDFQQFSSFCVPDSVTNGQLMEVFVKYNESTYISASVQLMSALEHYFPCKQETKRGAK